MYTKIKSFEVQKCVYHSNSYRVVMVSYGGCGLFNSIFIAVVDASRVMFNTLSGSHRAGVTG